MIKFRLLKGQLHETIRYGNFSITLSIIESDRRFESLLFVEVKHISDNGNVSSSISDILEINESDFELYVEKAHVVLVEQTVSLIPSFRLLQMMLRKMIYL
jgi:hypothetical protein